MRRKFTPILLILLLIFTGLSKKDKYNADCSDIVIPGDARFNLYINDISDKKVCLVANHTAIINSKHLLDTLLELNINIVKIFAPEHGFTGDFDAGEEFNDSQNKLKNMPVISLYGKKKKPSVEDMMGIDVVLFDIQDVGVRFFTYLSTLHYVMEACAENNVSLIVLDRPNPNGFYVDGPVLELKHKSFVGMHPVPIVYGMTIGEYAQMINGEGWLATDKKCDLKVIPCSNYNRDCTYSLPVVPSPNLQSDRAVLLYPSMALFEGTIMSVARGTSFAFEAFGHPEYPDTAYSFVPEKRQGAANPKYLGKKCYGRYLRNDDYNPLVEKKINIEYLVDAYNLMSSQDKFFNLFFYNLSGTKELRNSIEQGKNIEEIKNSWQPKLQEFMQVRKKYLIYADF